MRAPKILGDISLKRIAALIRKPSKKKMDPPWHLSLVLRDHYHAVWDQVAGSNLLDKYPVLNELTGLNIPDSKFEEIKDRDRTHKWRTVRIDRYMKKYTKALLKLRKNEVQYFHRYLAKYEL